jgi:hypothetical protein
MFLDTTALCLNVVTLSVIYFVSVFVVFFLFVLFVVADQYSELKYVAHDPWQFGIAGSAVLPAVVQNHLVED